ncbi:MAG: hypothetical protein SNJ74_09945 [Fimbriimonadaceae bacterium]
MIGKIALGTVIGGSLGFGYHLLMKVIGSSCISCQNSAVPVLIGIGMGILAVVTDRKDP